MDTNQKTQVIERLKQAQNVLVTVSNDPSVDQLAAAIGLALMMNKLGKHATAVFSGQVPSTLEFLRPEETLEATTDSLRDFIISLDKSKADKLRYKVEEDVVKIFITPYRTSLSEADLNFSQGDFNVDAVVALGVDLQEHLDQAIMAHGRILHDATVIGITSGAGTTDVGSINWIEPSASCLCEMLVSISEAFQSGLLDNQIATAFLTGIVSATERFSNDKTTPKVMTMSAQLMAAGANQQLISNKLALPSEPAPIQENDVVMPPASEDSEPPEPSLVVNDDEGTIDLHEAELPEELIPEPSPSTVERQLPVAEISIDEQGELHNPEEIDLNEDLPNKRPETYNRGLNLQPLTPEERAQYSGYVSEPPARGGTLTANSQPEQLDPSTDPLSVIPVASIPPPEQINIPDELPAVDQIVDSTAGAEPNLTGQAQDSTNSAATQSLADLESAVKMQSVQDQPQSLDAEAARQAVMDAVNSAGYDLNRPEPIQALNAQPLEINPELGQPPAVPPPLVPPFPSATNQSSQAANGNANAPEMPIPNDYAS